MKLRLDLDCVFEAQQRVLLEFELGECLTLLKNAATVRELAVGGLQLQFRLESIL